MEEGRSFRSSLPPNPSAPHRRRSFPHFPTHVRREFVKDLAARTGGTPATARWDAGSVLHVVAGLAGPRLLDRVLAALPSGYALLFGRAELALRR
ncbi:DUF2267 domain-containing protein [Streptomyces marianii]|uniref:DUF2267 domain-containing protein n=1 Tax=Streptomyces marianii TaxID=1817406 RepID=UPI001F478336|nr:DUF2267 domain-containing protein [Streptomyces marianii]